MDHDFVFMQNKMKGLRTMWYLCMEHPWKE